MLQTKLQGHLPKVEDFKGIFTIAAILDMWPRPSELTFIPCLAKAWLHIKHVFIVSQADVEEKMFENINRYSKSL